MSPLKSLVLLLSPLVAMSNSAEGGLSASPIRYLEPSLAASSAHSTVVAVLSCQNEEQCAVLVTYRASDSASSRLQGQQENLEQTQKFGLRLCDNDEDKESTAASSRWIQLGDSSICTMTGFAADVQHLTRVALKQVESYRTLYSRPMPVDRVVKSLSGTVQRAARIQGGRPYGIQAMIAGFDDNGRMLLYTVDPTGAWQHYGCGASAIGRGAMTVREKLYKGLKEATSNEDVGASEALRIALSSILDKSDKDGGNIDADNLEAVLVWKSYGDVCRMARIHDSEIEFSLQNIMKNAK